MKGFRDIRREINAHILKLHNIELRKEKARAGREMWAITKVRIKQVCNFIDKDIPAWQICHCTYTVSL